MASWVQPTRHILLECTSYSGVFFRALKDACGNTTILDRVPQLCCAPSQGWKERRASTHTSSLNSAIIRNFKLVLMLHWAQKVLIINEHFEILLILSHPFSFLCMFCSIFDILREGIMSIFLIRLYIFGGICSDLFTDEWVIRKV